MTMKCQKNKKLMIFNLYTGMSILQKDNIRFDARVLGYSVAQWIGGQEYHGSCIGCYWYDPFEFNQKISVNYNKDR